MLQMGYFSVNLKRLNDSLNKYTPMSRKLSLSFFSLRRVYSDLRIMGTPYVSVLRRLDELSAQIEGEQSRLDQLQNTLGDIVTVYRSTEEKILGLTGDPDETTDAKKSSSPFELSGFIQTILSKAGIVGPSITAVWKLVTGKWTSGTDIIKTITKGGKDILSVIGGVSSTISKGSNANWKEAIFGLTDGLSGIDTSSAGAAFNSSWVKQFGKDLSFKTAATTGDKIKVATKWGGHILTLVSNGVENYEEFGGFTKRMIAETTIETAVDIGVGALATAGVTAAASTLVAAGVITGAPAVAVGAVAAGAVWAANGICKWATGTFSSDHKQRDLGEVVADFVVDHKKELKTAALIAGGPATWIVGGAIQTGKTVARWLGNPFGKKVPVKV